MRAHRFARSAPIAGVWPWLAYTNDDAFCSLIRAGKFNDSPEIFEELGRRWAEWLVESGALHGVDAIVPVPMHWLKRLSRGYNQSELLARRASLASGVPVIKALRARRRHAAQSRKSGEQRAANVAGIFELCDGHGLQPGMRVALVDDILTTGATLSEAVRALLDTAPASITILTLAATSSH